MSVPWGLAGRRRWRPHRHHWQLAMGLQLLLLVLLCRAWPWAWASEQPSSPAGQPALSAQVANGSPEAVTVTVTVAVSSTVSLPSNHSELQDPPAPDLRQTLQRSLFILSGFCGVVALYFLARAFSFKISQSKKYALLANEERRAMASMDSDEDTVFELRLFK